jgi:hypothetical protein
VAQPSIRHRTRIGLACLLGAAALLGAASPGRASAAACNENAVIDRAYDGSIRGHFTLACLQKTQHDEPEEIRVYSPIDGVISAEIERLVLRSSTGSGGAVAVTVSKRTAIVDPGGARKDRLLQHASTLSVSDVPTPVFALGAFSLLVVAAGVAGSLLRRRLDTTDRG